mmetsp:Transcript_28180/g.48282  ORF Transcript_28180/g.48282 Transcript_28180/m.48282 type:complete len:379 (+) Transcript_28180:113-1249(+)
MKERLFIYILLFGRSLHTSFKREQGIAKSSKLSALLFERRKSSEDLLFEHGQLDADATQHVTVFLGSADQVRHDLFDLPVRDVLEGLVVRCAERISQVVSHAQELSEENVRLRTETALGGLGDGHLDGLLVVGGNHQLHLVAVRDLIEHVRNTSVVIVTGGLLGQVDRRSVAFVGSTGALQLHVGAAHQLAREVVISILGAGDVVQQATVGVGEVHLISAEDQRAILVVLFHQDVREIVNGGLEIRVFGVNHQLHVVLVCQVNDLVHTLTHHQQQLALFFGQSSSCQGALALAERGELVDLFDGEAVAPLDIIDGVVVVCVDHVERLVDVHATRKISLVLLFECLLGNQAGVIHIKLVEKVSDLDNGGGNALQQLRVT